MTNYAVQTSFWNSFNWELYVKFLQAKMKQEIIQKELTNIIEQKNGK